MAIGRPIELTPNIATKNISSLATDSQTQFTVTGGYRINEIAVYRNGVRLAEGRDFTASDGDTVNLVTAAEVDDVIEFAVFDSFNISDAIVSAASTQTLNGDFNITGNLYAGTFKPASLVATAATINSTIHVGTALTADASGNLNTVGVVTASSFSGDGSGLTGVASTDNILTGTAATFTNTGVNAGVPNVNIVGLATVGIITAYGTAELSSTLTVGGAVNIDATTDSTSTTTGALIVDGGLGVAKNVYIGAGLSVAGTLTYEDVTNVDSVGMVTAKSGVNVSGGELNVGLGFSVGHAGIITSTGGTIDLKNSGSVSNIKFYCESSNAHYTQLQSAAHSAYGGNVTLTLPTTTDTLIGKTTTDTLTNKTLTAPSFTGDISLSGSATGVSSVTWDASANSLIFNDNSKAVFGTGSDGFSIYHDGSQSRILENGTGGLRIGSDTGIELNKGTSENMLVCTPDAEVKLFYNNSKTFETTSNGVQISGTESQPAYLYVYADQGDDNGDKWVHAAETDGTYALKSYSTGSWVTGLSIAAGGASVTATKYIGDGSALTGVGGDMDITSCLFV